MNIVLTGMRGAGKSTIGKILAQKLNKDFLDLDEILEKKLGMKISDIVEKHGWDYFRNQESMVAQELNATNAVIATGGGVILKKENVNVLKKSGVFIFLNADAEILSSRIGNDNSRPPFTKGYATKSELRDVLRKRDVLYKNTADIIVETDKLSVEQSVKKILERFKGLCVIIGDPVEHSLSPKMHNAAYDVLGINDKFVYVKCHVKASELSAFIKGARIMNLRGICCTVPHKIEVMRYLDEIDDKAKKIGAVNTIVNNNGVLKGYNTDWLGCINPIEKLTSLKNKKVAVLGAGGAARAACYAVSSKNTSLTIYNRTLNKAEELTKEFSGKALSLEKLEKIKNADIIINATSVGLHENESPLPKKYISDNQIIFDLVYLPQGLTKLLKEAKKKNARIISGIEMLLYQGFEQFKLFTGHTAPENAMRKALL